MRIRRRLPVTIGSWLLAGVALIAADFWEERPFTEWSDKDVEKMLTDSPWALSARLQIAGTRHLIPETD
jgi:hypothetical protein